MNVPNSLTITRMLLAPVLAAAMLGGAATSIAAAIFAAGMATDFADGYIARTRGLKTSFGALMDPIADKLFVGTALVCLAADARLAVWVVVVIFAREALVTGLRLSARRRQIDIAANQFGKAKTITQALLVFVLLVADPTGTLTLGLVYLTIAITIFSGLIYVRDYSRGLSAPAPVPRVATAPSPAPAAHVRMRTRAPVA